jgi:hypothetical protein
VIRQGQICILRRDCLLGNLSQFTSFSSHGIARRRPIDCYVAVSVMRFNGDTTGQISVVARWSLRDANGKELVMRRSAYRESTAAQSSVPMPYSLVRMPAFPTARADVHGRAVISSYWCFGSCVSMLKIRSHIPALAQGVSRLCTLFQLP